MKIQDLFIIALAAVFCISNAILGLLAQQDFDVYFTVDAFLFILLTLAFNFSSRTMSSLRPIGVTMLIGFLMIVVFKIYDML